MIFHVFEIANQLLTHHSLYLGTVHFLRGRGGWWDFLGGGGGSPKKKTALKGGASKKNKGKGGVT